MSNANLHTLDPEMIHELAPDRGTHFRPWGRGAMSVVGRFFRVPEVVGQFKYPSIR